MTRRIGLTGVSRASSLALEVAQTGSEANGATDNWGNDGDTPWDGGTPGVEVRIKLTKRSNERIAPEGFFFEVEVAGFDNVRPNDDGAYDPTHHNLSYFWDFGDPGARWSAPENVMEHQRDANKGYGPTAAHVYETEGSYTVSVLVIEASSGKFAKAEFRIGGSNGDTPEILNADASFPNSRTLVIDQTGQGLTAYPNSLVFTTIEDAFNYVQNQIPPHRMIFRSGQTFVPTDHLGFLWNMPTIHCAGEPGSTPPVIKWEVGITRSSRLVYLAGYDPEDQKDLVFHNLAFEGGWDSTTETGHAVHDFMIAGANPGDYLLVHKSSAANFGGLAYRSDTGTGLERTRFWSDFTSIGHRGYHFLETQVSPSAYLGVKAISHPNALSGGDLNGKHNDSGGIRFQFSKNFIMDGCDVFCRSGWFENILGVRTQQPALRISQRGQRGTRSNIQRCSIEGSLSAGRMNATVTANVQNNLIERCFFVGTAFDSATLRINLGGCTIRNNIMIVPDVRRYDFYGLFSQSKFIETYVDDDEGARAGDLAESKAGPIKIYNNSGIQLMSAANNGNFRSFHISDTSLGRDVFDTIEVHNNVVQAPNLADPIVSDGPFEKVALWTPRHNGYRSAYHRQELILPSPVAPGGSFSMPYVTGRGPNDYDDPPEEPHRFAMSDETFRSSSAKQDVNVSFGPTTLTVTNGSTEAWPAGPAVLVLYCKTSPITWGNYATNTEPVHLYFPTGDSPALGSADDRFCAIGDFFGEFRPPYPSKGALEARE